LKTFKILALFCQAATKGCRSVGVPSPLKSNPRHRSVVCRSGRDLVEGAGSGIDLILVLASRKRLVLVDEIAIPRPADQGDVASLNLGAYGSARTSLLPVTLSD
jgi:hypothetical protein